MKLRTLFSSPSSIRISFKCPYETIMRRSDPNIHAKMGRKYAKFTKLCHNSSSRFCLGVIILHCLTFHCRHLFSLPSRIPQLPRRGFHFISSSTYVTEERNVIWSDAMGRQKLARARGPLFCKDIDFHCLVHHIKCCPSKKFLTYTHPRFIFIPCIQIKRKIAWKFGQMLQRNWWILDRNMHKIFLPNIQNGIMAWKRK